MSTNRGTILKQILPELLESHRGNFDAYIGRSALFEVVPVSTQRGLISQLPIAQGRVAMEDPSRSAKMTPGDQTPRGNLEFNQRAYFAQLYGFEELINKTVKLETSAYAASAAIGNLLRDRAALNVIGSHERDLEQILLGNGLAADGRNVTTKSLTSGEKFNKYDTTISDVVATIQLMIDALGGGAPNLIIGIAIARALQRHPQVTDKDAGTGKEIVGLPYVLDWLRGQGFGQVVLSENESTIRARELGYLRSAYHNNVFCAFQPGAIRRVVQEDLVYDTYEDKRSRSEVVSAHMTSGHMVTHAEDVYALQAILS
jgi:predicted GNAT family acetyltransferase